MLDTLQSWVLGTGSEQTRYDLALLKAEIALLNKAPEQTIGLLEPLTPTRARLLLLNRARLQIAQASLSDRARAPSNPTSTISTISTTSANNRSNSSSNSSLATQSVNDLHEWVVLHPKDAQAWDLLSQAQAVSLDMLGSTRSLAESFAVKFNVNAAVDRMIAAQNFAKQLARERSMTRAQEMEASIIDTRLRELLQLKREQSLQR